MKPASVLRTFRPIAALALPAFMSLMTPMLASPLRAGPQDAHGHSHDYEFTEPASLSEAVRRIEHYLGDIAADLAGGGSDHVHNDADAVSRSAKLLGRLALKPESGVARAKVRDINLKGKEIAAAADLLHEAADAGDWKAAAAHFEILRHAFEDLLALAPAGYTVDVKPGESTITPGKPVPLAITLKDPAGVTVRDLKIVHERPLHLLAVSKDLSWYLHEHPARNADGTFAVSITFPHAGEFILFHDFTPAAEGAGNPVVPVPLTVAGSPPAPVPLKVDPLVMTPIEGAPGYAARLRCNADDFVPRRDTLLRFTVEKDKTPLNDLEPYLGALGHLVIFSEDLRHFVHAHPLSEDELRALKPAAAGEKPADKPADKPAAGGHEGHAHHLVPGGGIKHPDDYADGEKADVIFHVSFPAPGLYKMFAQFQHQGRVLTLPWTVRVYDAPPGKPSAAPASTPADRPDHEKKAG